MKMKNSTFRLSCFILLLMASFNMYGQGSMGQISGKVISAKESLVGAAVQLKNTSTGFTAGKVKGFSLGFSFMAAYQRRFNVVTTGNLDGTNARDLAYIPVQLGAKFDF